MSQSGVPYVEGLNCTNCGRFIKFQPCKSTRNGNKGVLFATCHGVNDKGEQCSFIRRASKSPSASPTLPSEPTFPGPPPLAASVPVPQAMGTKCPIHTCGQSRIADDCQRRVCRKHCIEAGGCSSKKHKVSTGAASAAPTAPLALPSRPPPVPSLPSASSTFFSQESLWSTPLSTPPPPSTVELPLPETVDARPDPRFSTHLRPIFTSLVAEQQELAHQQRKTDAERQENAHKVKKRIALYVWSSEDTPHTVHVVQHGSHGFAWPYLAISSTLLAAVGLSEASERGDLRMYEETDITDWVAVDVGYVVEVQEGQRIFLKDRSLRKCMDFQKCLDTPHRNSTPHLHYNLPRERAYVREMLKTVSPISSPRQITPLALTSLPLPHVVKHEHAAMSFVDPTPSPTPSQGEPSYAGAGVLNDPIELSDDEEKRWPGDYHVVDIARCFRECSARTTRRQHRARSQQAIFAQHFPKIRYVASTFSDQKSLWNSASGSLREEFIETGRCKDGLWSVFARRVRRAGKQKALSQDVIEID
ncbi:hypothetical protein BDZ97DRAFT_1681014 [Flammula alnicola]|nr:hypothetical protein BDZ97DRAFT_1681014 [Flammula alnicola]